MTHTRSDPTSIAADAATDRRSRIVTGLILLALCVALAAERFPFRHGPFHNDVCTYALIGHEMLGGRKLYSDLWDHKPPLHYATYAAAEMLVGYGDGEIYLLNVAGAVGVLVGVYHAGRACGAGRV